MLGRSVLAGLVCAALLGAAAPAGAVTQIGVAAAVRGSVQVLRPAAIGTALQSGAKLFLGDKVATGADAGLQILLLDQTVFTLGPNSELTLDTFVYDPDSGNGKVDAKLVKGAFRFISGRVARKDPRQMNVALPSGTIGIRGTIVYAVVDGDAGSSTVVLAGPGEGNTNGETAGAIQVTNAGVAVDVLKSGWGVQVPGTGQPPTEPFRAPEGFFESFQFDAQGPAQSSAPGKAEGGKSESGKSDGAKSDGAPSDAQPGTSSDSASSDASPANGGSEDPAPALSPATVAGAQLDTAQVASQTNQVYVDNLTNTVLPISDPVPPTTTTMPPTVPPTVLPPNGPVFSPTLVTDLTSLAGTFMGTYLYDAPRLALQNGGTLDLSVALDFTLQQVNVNVKNVSSPGLAIQGMGVGFGSMGFGGSETPEAAYDMVFDYNDTPSGCVASTCSAEVQVSLKNQDAQVAAQMSATVIVTQSQIAGGTDTATVTDLPVRIVP